jgi:predicted exporter
LLHPLAVSALGGLVTSCVVLLFLLPPFLLGTHGRRPAPAQAEPARTEPAGAEPAAAEPAAAEPAGAVPVLADAVRSRADDLQSSPRTMRVSPRVPADDGATSTTHRIGDEGNDR